MEIKVIVDLRDQFGDARDQGPRPTCMAFAASDAHSFACGSADPLSAEYAFFHAVQRKLDPDRTKGVPFELISEAISNDGQPLEQGWPYITNLSTTDDWRPPDNQGTLFYRKSRRSIQDLPTIYGELDRGHPVILGMHISIGFFNAKADTILIAPASEPAKNTHAVVGVGYGESNVGRCLLIRNSWGKKWCDQGHGWIHEQYLKPRLLCVGVME